MDKAARKARALALVNDEMFGAAFAEISDRIVKDLLTAKTPEEREKRFQEYHGLKRAFELLKIWSSETVKEQ